MTDSIFNSPADMLPRLRAMNRADRQISLSVCPGQRRFFMPPLREAERRNGAGNNWGTFAKAPRPSFAGQARLPALHRGVLIRRHPYKADWIGSGRTLPSCPDRRMPLRWQLPTAGSMANLIGMTRSIGSLGSHRGGQRVGGRRSIATRPIVLLSLSE
jgi:hypothetical protein